MDFSVRALELRERMDDVDCDPRRLRNTYRDFQRINRWLAGWRGVYRTRIRPQLPTGGREVRVLDIGCGGAGLLPDLHRWMTKDGLSPRLTGIDPDLRAVEFARELPLPPCMDFRCVSVQALAREGARFDVVVCNHVLHHLHEDEIEPFLDAIHRVSDGVAVVGDAVRSRWGYLLFKSAFGPFFRESFIVEDGLASIRRAFTVDEMRARVPSDWEVRPQFPFRLLMIHPARRSPSTR